MRGKPYSVCQECAIRRQLRVKAFCAAVPRQVRARLQRRAQRTESSPGIVGYALRNGAILPTPTRLLPYASTDGECVVVGSGRCTIARIFGSHYCRCSCLSLRIALRKTDSVQKLRHCNNDALIGKAANVADSVARSTCYPREEQNRERGKSFALSLARVPSY